jgi:hypothetical protein
MVLTAGGELSRSLKVGDISSKNKFFNPYRRSIMKRLIEFPLEDGSRMSLKRNAYQRHLEKAQRRPACARLMNTTLR